MRDGNEGKYRGAKGRHLGPEGAKGGHLGPGLAEKVAEGETSDYELSWKVERDDQQYIRNVMKN